MMPIMRKCRPGVTMHLPPTPASHVCALSGPGARWFMIGDTPAAREHNTVLVTCVDEAGDAIRGLIRDDFRVDIDGARSTT